MKVRAIILIIATLILGVVIGMLISAQIRYARLKPMRVFFSEERFREGFFNIIQPDEKQANTINNILSRFAKSNSEIQSDFRRKTDSLFKEMWKEIEPNLTKEQIDRLKEAERRRMEMIKRGRRTPNDSVRFRPPQGPDRQWQDPGRNRRPPDFDRRMQHRRVQDTLSQPAV